MAVGRVSTNQYSVSNFIVDGGGLSEGATHTTIQGAIDDASSGDTIAIRPGTYTEDLTLKAGVNLSGGNPNGIGSLVTIIGKLTADYTGTCALSFLEFQNSEDLILDHGGTTECNVIFSNCTLLITDNDGILSDNSSSSSSLQFFWTRMSISSSGITLFTKSCPGLLRFSWSKLENTSSTTASTSSAGNTIIEFCRWTGIPVETSGSGILQTSRSAWGLSALNATAITIGVNSPNNFCNQCGVNTGSASCISISAGALLNVQNTVLGSTNTNAVTGAGTLEYSQISLSSTSTAINPTSVTGRSVLAENLSFDLGANYLSHYVEGSWTPSLTGSTSNPTVTYNSQLGKYTRIGNVVHAKYHININTYSGGSGDLRISGLPFTASNDAMDSRNSPFMTNANWGTSRTQITHSVDANVAHFKFLGIQNSGTFSLLAVGDIGTSTVLRGEITYWV